MSQERCLSGKRGKRCKAKPYKHLVVQLLFAILEHVNRLTRQEQLVLCIVLGLLLTGWAVKAYRTAHPLATAKQSEAGLAAPERSEGGPPPVEHANH